MNFYHLKNISTMSGIRVVSGSSGKRVLGQHALNLATGDVENLEDTISQILGIKGTEGWSIVDANGDLVMVSASDDADQTKYGWLRGVIVDIPRRKIVSKSMGWSPVVVSDELVAVDNNLVLTDLFGITHKVALEENTITLGEEGTVVRVFKLNGVTYFAGQKKLDVRRSRWGKTKPFLEIFTELVGKQPEDVVEEGEVATFILVHPDLLFASKQDIGKGYAVLLDGTAIAGNYLTPEVVDLKNANDYLYNGYYDTPSDLSPRARPGEFVMIKSSNGYIKVMSDGYSWREEMIGGDNNLKHRFFELTNLARGPTQGQEFSRFQEVYKQKFPIFNEGVISEENLGEIFSWPFGEADQEESEKILENRDTRLKNMATAFLMAVPLHRQKEVYGFLQYLFDERKELGKWMSQLPNDEDPELDKRIRQILGIARKSAIDEYARNKKISVDILIQRNILNLLQKEEGLSLYRMINVMKVATGQKPMFVKN